MKADSCACTISSTSGQGVLMCKTSCESAKMEAYHLDKSCTSPKGKLKSLCQEGPRTVPMGGALAS